MFFSTLTPLALILAATQTAFARPAQSDLDKRMTYRENKISMKVVGQPRDNTYGIVAGYFGIEDFSITSGQDKNHKSYHGQIIQGVEQDNSTEFVFSVGRSGSTQVADWWNARIPPNQNTFGHTAGKLNFAYIGDLVLTYRVPITPDASVAFDVTSVFPSVGFAQGHSGATNNWWFGGITARPSLIEKDSVDIDGVDSLGNIVTWTFHRGDSDRGLDDGDVSTIYVTQIVQRVRQNTGGFVENMVLPSSLSRSNSTLIASNTTIPISSSVVPLSTATETATSVTLSASATATATGFVKRYVHLH